MIIFMVFTFLNNLLCALLKCDKSKVIVNIDHDRAIMRISEFDINSSDLKFTHVKLKRKIYKNKFYFWLKPTNLAHPCIPVLYATLRGHSGKTHIDIKIGALLEQKIFLIIFLLFFVIVTAEQLINMSVIHYFILIVLVFFIMILLLSLQFVTRLKANKILYKIFLEIYHDVIIKREGFIYKYFK